MAVSVVSSLAASTSKASIAPAADNAAGLSIDFSTILLTQTAGSGVAIEAKSQNNLPPETLASTPENTEAPGSAEASILAMMLGIPELAKPVTFAKQATAASSHPVPTEQPDAVTKPPSEPWLTLPAGTQPAVNSSEKADPSGLAASNKDDHNKSDLSPAESSDTTNLPTIIGMPQWAPPATVSRQVGSFTPSNDSPPNGNLEASAEMGNIAKEIPNQLAAMKSTETTATTTFIDTSRLAENQGSSDAANIAADSSKNLSSLANSGLSSINGQQQSGNVAATTHITVEAPLNSKVWPEQLGNKIVWLVKNDQQSAQININPPQLGPVQITLHLNGDQANAVFASPHAEVRHAIESALPQLRDMLAASGITLGDANVGANLSQQNQNAPFTNANRNPSRDENAILPANDTPVSSSAGRALQSGRGLVDLFA